MVSFNSRRTDDDSVAALLFFLSAIILDVLMKDRFVVGLVIAAIDCMHETKNTQ